MQIMQREVLHSAALVIHITVFKIVYRQTLIIHTVNVSEYPRMMHYFLFIPPILNLDLWS